MMEKIKVIFILAFMMIAFSINALAVEIEPDVRYSGETTLESGDHGVSFGAAIIMKVPLSCSARTGLSINISSPVVLGAG